jgi:septum formation protein
MKRDARDEGLGVEQTALRLAIAKAGFVSDAYPDSFVLGADQILDCEGQWFDKPDDMSAARLNLQNLRGKCHRLVNGLAIFYGGSIIWTHTAIATLQMRNFSDAFLDDYLAESGEKILGSVGADLLENRGAQLFQAIEGDYFTILGLPLLPVLDLLRDQKVIQS